MILKKEIEKAAEKEGVLKTTIDKDWVLGHFIDAIYSLPECKEHLVFKGGTCLRKCYFPDYRFSEDLDFTSVSKSFELNKKLLNRVMKLVMERAEIPLHLEKMVPLYSNDRHTGYQATIKSWGADHPRNQPPPSPERWNTSIKIEVTLFEQMSFSMENREVFHPYSDHLSETSLKVPCYSIEEILSEKLRSLIQRSYAAPRDFYDIWFLSQYGGEINWKGIVEAFHQKMAFKGLIFDGIHQMINEDNDKKLKAAWENSLGHQVAEKNLPSYELARDEIEKLLNEIFSGK